MTDPPVTVISPLYGRLPIFGRGEFRSFQLAGLPYPWGREGGGLFSGENRFWDWALSPNLYPFKEPGIDSTQLCSMAGRYVKSGCRTGPPG